MLIYIISFFFVVKAVIKFSANSIVESWFESLKFWVLASLSVSSCSATLPFAAAVLLQKVRSYLGICSLCRPQMDSFLTWKEERNEKVYSLLPSSHRIIRGKLFTVLVDKIIRTTTAEWMGQSYNLQLACPKHCHGGGRGHRTSSSSPPFNGYTPPNISNMMCQKKLINWSGRFYASSAALHWFSELHVNVLAFLINCHSSHNVAWKLKKNT